MLRPMSDHATPPFTAAQIREATPPGRAYTWRVARATGPAVIRRLEFADVTETGCTTIATNATEDGFMLGEDTDNPTWDDLVSHALWPDGVTEIAEASLSTPAGEFERCMLYTVQMGSDTIKAWFAPELPGAPVQLNMERGDQVTMSMVLTHHELP